MKELAKDNYKKANICLTLVVINFILLNLILLGVLGVITIFH